ncbi:MAG: hypothetical protein A49_14430 [Methyloceanibacter sp.]|nr:MAG: hypothetical protein A49_14430 [Methyloceanibacter sp.]
MNIIAELEKEQVAERLNTRSVPQFGPGDTVRVNVKVVEGERSRIQAYEGVCIGRAGGGIHENFTVRKISYGEGVERVFPIHSPLIDSIEVVRHGRVRRAKLYYLRGRRGKSARIPERRDTRTDGKGKKAHGFKGFTKPKGEPDDLKLIAGITADIETKLHKLGVTKFDQIANLSDDGMAYIADKLSLGSQIEDNDWSAKALALMAETTADEVPAGDGEAETAETKDA